MQVSAAVHGGQYVMREEERMIDVRLRLPHSVHMFLM